MTPNEARLRKNRIRDAELYGWQFVCALTDEEFSAACNGCGPESWSEEKRRKLTKWLAIFALAFNVHDCRFEYDNDGSREKFDYANSELEKNCYLLADQKYSWWNPMRYLARRGGRLVYKACDMFGWDAYQEAYRKSGKGGR